MKSSLNISSSSSKPKIVFVVDWHSDLMGYSDNYLPEAFARLGWQVHLVTSTREVFYNRRNKKWYKRNLEKFLGKGKKKPGSYMSGQVVVHRLKSIELFGYIFLMKLCRTLREIEPQIVQSGEYWTGPTFQIAKRNRTSRFLFTTECHVHSSVFSQSKWNSSLSYPRKSFAKYLATRIDFCFPISDDSASIARNFFALPGDKSRVINLGTDTVLFHPLDNKGERRKILGFDPNSFICIYTGKLIESKGVHLLTRAVETLANKGHKIQAVLIGNGESAYLRQLKSDYCKVFPYLPANKLADYYAISDIGVWPKQESTSQLDALACGLPIIISNRHGDPNRSENSGSTYSEGDYLALAEEIEKFIFDMEKLSNHSLCAREKALNKYSWDILVQEYVSEIANLMQKKLLH